MSYDRILFEFNEFYLVVDLNLEFKSNNEDDIENYQNDSYSDISLKELPKYFSKVEIAELYISDAEYLGYREDLKIMGEDFFQNSISTSLYALLSSIISLNLIQFSEIHYELDINYGYNDIDYSHYGFCGSESNDESNFIYKIYIPIEYIKILGELTKIYIRPKVNVPKFYWFFYYQNKPLDDQLNIKILTTNTKARRLGYFVLLADFFHLNTKVSASLINKKFEEFVSQPHINEELTSYKNNKGDIKITKTGISAKPYIALAEQLGLIKKINNVYFIGKNLKVYNIIRNLDIDKEKKEIFELDKFSKLFFFEEILKSDFLYFSTLVEIIYIKKEVSFLYLRDIFQQKIFNRLDSLIKKFNLPYSTKKEILKVSRRIKNWEKPKVYLEHILMPRINWLYDLDLINFKDERLFYLNKKGRILFDNLCRWYDIEGWHIVDSEQYVSRFYQCIFNLIYEPNNKINKKEDFDLDKLRERIHTHIEDSFEKFKTLAPNRVTLSQAIQYTKYNLFLQNSVPVGYKFIENHIKEHLKDKYIYKYQSQYKDGYLQKLNI